MLENITKIEELFDLFNLNAKDYPETLALKSHDGTFTYSELVTAIDRASSCMIEQNCVPGDFIGCSLEAGSQKLIILLAALKIGVVFVNLPTELPDNIIVSLINSLKIKHFIGKRILSNNLVRKIEIDFSKKNNSILTANRKCTDFAVVCLSSGTTGIPKAIPISNKGLLHKMLRVHQNLKAYGSIVCHFGQFWPHHDLQILSKGQSLHIYNLKISGLNGIHKFLVQEKISTLYSFTSIIKQFDFSGKPTLKNLKAVYLTGEKLYRHDIQEFKKVVPSTTHLITGYSSTETGPVTTNYSNFEQFEEKVHLAKYYGSAETDSFTKNSYIDKKNGGLFQFIHSKEEIKILDENDNQVEIESIGEIVIVNDCLPTGYLNNNEQSIKKFRKLPTEKSLAFFTGDLGFFDASGCLNLVGRKDDHVKINGFLVNTIEVEQLIIDNFDMSSVSVIGYEEFRKQTKLFCFYTSNNKIEEKKIRQKLAKIAPGYMTPKRFQRLKELPKTSSGKVKKMELKNFIDSSIIEFTNEYKGEIELFVYNQFVKNLGHTDFNALDSFFEIGGDSISALNLILEIEKKYNLHIPFEDFILEGASIKIILSKIQSARSNKKIDLISLNKSTMKEIIYVFPVVDGYFTDYLPLANALTPFYRVIGVKINHLFNDTNFTIESLIDEACEKILSQNEQLQINLLGFSSAGLIAYQAAQNILRRDLKVHQLILIDTAMPQKKRRTPLALSWYTRKWKFKIRATFGKTNKNRLKSFQNLKTRKQLSYWRSSKINVEHPILFAAEKGFLYSDNKIKKWKEAFNQELDIFIIPGNHVGLRAPKISNEIANKLFKKKVVNLN